MPPSSRWRPPLAAMALTVLVTLAFATPLSAAGPAPGTEPVRAGTIGRGGAVRDDAPDHRRAADAPHPSLSTDSHDHFLSGSAAVGAVREHLPHHARGHGFDRRELEADLLADPTLHVSRTGSLLYIDAAHPETARRRAPLAPGAGPAAAPPVDGPAFQLHSHPEADHTIYLDFDGHTATGTRWNTDSGMSSITTGAYDLDGDPDSWSAAELSVITRSWEAVAEDFAPWNVDVTTEEPPVDDLRHSGSSDTRWGIRVVITPDDWDGCGCGGFAYVGGFDASVDEPVYVFNQTFVGVAEAVTHETGHALGLAHDGLSTGTEYYDGHGSGEESWAPIMGSGYVETVTQWSRGDYFSANNNDASANFGQGPDDLAIIGSLTNGNGFGPRSDDHGDDHTASTEAASGSALVGSGVIETADDVDAFSFTTGAGTVSIDVDLVTPRPNLNVQLQLTDDTGTVLVTASPPTLDATISTTLPEGTYHLLVTGVGAGLPQASTPSGYTDYASLGGYAVSGTIVEPSAPDTTPPAPPVGVTATTSGATIVLDWEDGPEADLAASTVYRSTTPGGPYSPIGTSSAPTSTYTDATAAADTPYHYIVTATDAAGNESSPSAEVSAELRSPAPASAPDHPDGATDVPVDDPLSWAVAEPGTTSDLLVGTDPAALVRLGDDLAAPWADPAGFAPNTTYYWRIDTGNAVGTTVGPVWSFTTGGPAVMAPIRIDRIDMGDVWAPGGRRRGWASVTVLDGDGQPVPGMRVVGAFVGDLGQSGRSAVTDRYGIAVVTSTVTAPEPVVQFCVSTVLGDGWALDRGASVGVCGPGTD